MRVGSLSEALLCDDPDQSGDARGGARAPGSTAPRSRLGIALAVALLALMVSPAWTLAGGAVQLLARRGVVARRPAGPCRGADLQPTERDLASIRAATLCLVNRERARWGEARLVPNRRLEWAAQGHTEGMVFGGYFAHVGPRGDTLARRMRAVGYISSSHVGFEVGENIGWGTLWAATPRAIVAAWMASPGHRANILDARFRQSAVGVSPNPPSWLAGGQAGAMYTQDFGGGSATAPLAASKGRITRRPR
jgi:uncharacterized protein YkwD